MVIGRVSAQVCGALHRVPPSGPPVGWCVFVSNRSAGHDFWGRLRGGTGFGVSTSGPSRVGVVDCVSVVAEEPGVLAYATPVIAEEPGVLVYANIAEGSGVPAYAIADRSSVGPEC